MAENPTPFQDFPQVSAQQWKQRVQYELKGEDYFQALVWDSPEGIRVNPIYSQSPQIEVPALQHDSFQICQDIFVHDVEKTVRRSNSSIKRGADCLRLRISNPETDITALLNGIPLENRRLFFDISFFSIDFVRSVKDKLAGKEAEVFFLIDPIHRLAKEGNWLNGGDNFKMLECLQREYPDAGFMSINVSLYANAGANLVQQIAYAVAHSAEYLNQFKTPKPVVFELAIGPDYFFEIAKIRALRLVFETVAKAFGHPAGCHIYASPGLRNKTLYDYNVNMLRTTTESMSAIIGGSDTVSNLPYDFIYHKSNEFGERIARNQLLILKNESHFSQASNAAKGSYFIENLTQQLAEKALVLVKEIEAEGGFLALLKKGIIQKNIKKQADLQQQDFDSGKTILVGTNKYPDASNRMKENLELYPFVKKKGRKTLVIPIIEKRLAEESEMTRLEKEESETLNP
ncbi:methylmalonyl-CoA mutase subunit beta [Flavobacterium silvaticum]|uniref:Methylmalonyl-CoA mutase n=1 Tax=Flavobacterium silvaticum TaxID=1852020 RepID=A0A972JHL3_9FLAO|nr:methylmalonyl-CoA mutase subunit beta [Flavobacterium silvaticum]NMH29351.1 methylmalonyl-CoA mutase [Flavobacterium silvaticum]